MNRVTKPFCIYEMKCKWKGVRCWMCSRMSFRADLFEAIEFISNEEVIESDAR